MLKGLLAGGVIGFLLRRGRETCLTRGEGGAGDLLRRFLKDLSKRGKDREEVPNPKKDLASEALAK